MENDYRIDPELNEIMPRLTKEELEELENSLLKDGYKGAPLIVWGDIIIDGHNRYQLCKKHNIPYEVQKMEFESKEEVIQWMIRAQLGRRNLNSAQRIALVKKFRPIYEKQAKENQSKAVSESNKNRAKSALVNLPSMDSELKPINTSEKLASIAGVSDKTYRMGEKVLNSDNLELKEEMLSGEKSVSAAHKELQRLEREGHPIILPVQENVDKPPEAYESDFNTEVELNHIKKTHHSYLESIEKGIQWLMSKEFYGEDGDEFTSRIRSDLSNYLEGFKGFERLIENLQPDDCEDDEVIIVKK